MKKIIIALFCCVSLVGCDDGKVAVPDNNFERALIELDYDDLIDGYVLKSGIKNCKELDVRDKGISDLTGIEAFTYLENLRCDYNQLTNLNVSQNHALIRLNCSNNKLISLDISNNTYLEILFCNNNQLTNLDFRYYNTALQVINCTNNKFDCEALKAKYNL
ncbi:MAG: hypothetical protein VXY47_04615 [Bacteroidota bacterium]|nr:hypothetical protein [Bacteroidota bacterium]